MPHSAIHLTPLFINYDDENIAMGKYDARDILNMTFVEDGNTFVLTNIGGSRKVSYPLGNLRHKCIGAVENKGHNSVIYFLWCEDASKHKIMLYNHTDNTILKVIEYGFGWKENTRITAIDIVSDDKRQLLYWEDNHGPRKINITKALNKYGVKKWNVYFPKTNIFTRQILFAIKAEDSNGVAVSEPGKNNLYAKQFAEFNQPQEYDEVFSIIESDNSSGNYIYTVKKCACHLEIYTSHKDVVRMMVVAYTASGIRVPLLVVPDNWYGDVLHDRMFDHGKYPMIFPPDVKYGMDASRLNNDVEDTVWQFRAYLHYDDDEKSVLSPISIIPIDNIVCNKEKSRRLNYIDINLTDPVLIDQVGLVSVKEVSICARRGINGVWEEVARINPCEYFDVDENLVPYAHYKFYNNTTRIAIPEADSALLYDDLPLSSRAQIYTRGRLIKGGVKKGYDTPECANIELKPVLTDDPTPEMYEVTFQIFVLSQRLDDNQDLSDRSIYPHSYEIRGPIMQVLNEDPEGPGGAFPTFGGLHFSGKNANIPHEYRYLNQVKYKYQQILPEGGWFCYSAGTNYGGISKQIDIGFANTKEGAIIIGYDGEAKNEILQELANWLSPWKTPPNEIFSVVKVRVPKGRHIFRLASHWCSFGDKLGKGALYDLNNGMACHKTSTYVWGVQYPDGTYKYDTEIVVDVVDRDVYGGKFFIKDLTLTDPNNDDDIGIPICGYLYDALGEIDIDNVLEKYTPVHRAYVTLTGVQFAAGGGLNWSGGETYLQGSERKKCITDHNGFFFFTADVTNHYRIVAHQVNRITGLQNSTVIAYVENGKPMNVGGSVYDEVFIGRGGYQFNYNPEGKDSLQDFFDKNLLPLPRVSESSGGMALPKERLIQIILLTDTPKARAECSTVIRGTITDHDDIPVEGAYVVLSNGAEAVTDKNGEYRLIVWGDMLHNNLPSNNNDRRCFVQWIIPHHCFPDYNVIPYGSNTGMYQDVYIDQFGENPSTMPAPYSPTAIYDMDKVFGGAKRIDMSKPIIYKSWKRGGEYKYGIVYYYDDLLRQSQVVTNALMKSVKIPFITDAAPYGPALLEYNIKHAPPRDAKYYQIVVSRDIKHARYFTWVINDVRYVNAVIKNTIDGVSTYEYIPSAYGNPDANMVLLDFGNIADYAKNNFGATLPFGWNNGDKVRIIADEKGKVLSSSVEYKAVSFDPPSVIIVPNDYKNIEIKPGMLVQLYSDNKEVDSEIYFERGEMHRCTNPGSPNNQHSVTTGILKSGDTYWRNRSIPILNDYKNIYSVYDRYVECPNISDFYTSDGEDIGRVQINADDQTQNYKSMLVISGNYIPNTKINDLSRFRPSEYVILDHNGGYVTALKESSDILHIVQEHANSSAYLGRTEITTADNGGFVIAAKSFIGTINKIIGINGTTISGSVVSNENDIYAVDVYTQDVWRKSNNGVYQISREKVQKFFNRYNQNNVWDICSVFYREKRQYIITIWYAVNVQMKVGSVNNGVVALTYTGTPVDAVNILKAMDVVELKYFDKNLKKDVTEYKDVNDISVTSPSDFIVVVNNINVSVGDIVSMRFRGHAETIAYHDSTIQNFRRWLSRYSFTPEEYCSVGDKCVMFKDGELYIHDEDSINRNVFFGVQYPSQITVVGMDNIHVKKWLSIALDIQQSDGKNNWYAKSVYNNTQQSRIVKDSFVKKEQYWHSEFKRDINTASEPNAIVNGKVIRSSDINIVLENNHPGFVKLRGIRLIYEPSMRNII